MPETLKIKRDDESSSSDKFTILYKHVHTNYLSYHKHQYSTQIYAESLCNIHIRKQD